MLNIQTQSYLWEFRGQELSDPDLVDTLVLSMCDNCKINYPHFTLNLVINELITNAIDHGVLRLDSRIKQSSTGFAQYLMQRTKRLEELAVGNVCVHAEWVENTVLRITVQDSGAGFVAESEIGSDTYIGYFCDAAVVKENNFPLYGRGLLIVRDLCKSVVHLDGGNCTVVEFDVSSPVVSSKNVS